MQNRAVAVSDGGNEAIRVLVADDNEVDRRVLTTIVEKAGYEVIGAIDGNDAIDKYHSQRPNLVLLDALMPGKNGFEVAQEIKQAAGEEFIPIIFLTSLTEARELARCVEAGGDDFLSKPYNRIILEAKLSALQRMRGMQTTLKMQHDEITMHHMQLVADQEAAKAVFDNIAHARQLDVPYVRHSISPLALFNGDVFLAARSLTGSFYTLLGDFTGHGLAAAIGALPLADVFYGMSSKGFSLAEIARECNRKLNSVLPPGYFCCATLAAFDFHRGTVEYWNGGVPSAYIKRMTRSDVVELASENLPLGILGSDSFSDETTVVEVDVGDRVFLATDGVIEARNNAGEYFGSDRLESILRDSSAEQIFERVHDSVYGYVREDDRDDDITMIEITVIEPESENQSQGGATVQLDGPKDWKLTYELGPESLKEFNPLPLLQQILMQAPYLRDKTSEIYTVLAELYSNALEHGVLGLSSNLKNSAEGFSQYYAQRAAALEQVSGFVRFSLDSSISDGFVRLNISVTDSGCGFDYTKALGRNKTARNEGYHGRGIKLLLELCESVEYQDPGNCVSVDMRWSTENE